MCISFTRPSIPRNSSVSSGGGVPGMLSIFMSELLCAISRCSDTNSFNKQTLNSVDELACRAKALQPDCRRVA